MERVDQFIISALEASVLVAPRNHGLTDKELVEVATRAGLRPGETSDAISRFRPNRLAGNNLLRLQRGRPSGLSADFNYAPEPDHRDPVAFEFIRTELLALARELGAARAELSRDVLVERAVARGIDRMAVEVAISVTVLDGILAENDGLVRHAPNRIDWAMPSQQISDRRRNDEHVVTNSWLAVALPMVKDVISRRGDGRSQTLDPFGAFEAYLQVLGKARFTAWWKQKRQEMVLLEPSSNPVALTVLCAALAEAALCFVVPHAKSLGLMKSLEEDKPRRWKFVDLVKSARATVPNVQPILEERLAARCLDLNDARQRIHAGFLIDAAESGPIPDLRPEEARDALHTTELVVRRIVEWLVETGLTGQ